MNKQDARDIVAGLERILKRINNGEFDVLAYEKDSLEQIIERVKLNKEPMAAYFSLEDWLYDSNNENKPVEIKSAMIWGALWIVKQMGCIDWDSMKSCYGEFMSKQMNVR